MDDKCRDMGGLTNLVRADIDPRPPAIPYKMDLLNDTLSDLDSALSLLVHRVGPILNPNASVEPEGDRKDAEKPSESDLAASIERQIQRVRNMTWVLTDVTQRVEL
jgi:hypothetical protein